MKRTCKRCGHSWYQRKSQKTRVCPNTRCHSVNWEEPKPVKVRKDAKERKPISRPIEIPEPLREKYIKRFWSKVLILGPDDCWPWKCGRYKDGYGKFSVYGRGSIPANRFVIYATTGESPGDCAMHTCDNPPCCNPSHIKSGSYSENNSEIHRKGRAKGKQRQPIGNLRFLSP